MSLSTAHGVALPTDPLLGECKCFSGYVSGDLQGNKGARGDCGAKESLYKDPYEVKTPKY